jgi:autotransporter-associated beta strand protein
MNTPTKFLLTAVLSLGLAVSAQAATLTWTGGGDGVSWNDADNWGGFTPASGDTLIFTSAANGQTLNNNTAADNTYIINFATGANNITFSGNRVTSLQNAWFTTANNNTFGSHTINFDVLMNNPDASQRLTTFRPGSGQTWTVNSLLTSTTADSGLQVTGGGNAIFTNDDNSFDGNISVIGNSTMSFTSLNNVGQNSSLGTGTSNNASRPGSVLRVGAGTLNFVGSSDSTTDRTWLQANATTSRLFANGTDGAKIVFTGDGDGNFSAQAAGTGTRPFTLGGDSTADNEISGIISTWSTTTGITSVTKIGDGKWILSGANTYSGGTTVSAGTLVVGNNSALGTGGVTVASGGRLTADASNRTISNTVTNSASGGAIFGQDGAGRLILAGDFISGAGGGQRAITTNGEVELSGEFVTQAGGSAARDFVGGGTFIISSAQTKLNAINNDRYYLTHGAVALLTAMQQAPTSALTCATLGPFRARANCKWTTL